MQYSSCPSCGFLIDRAGTICRFCGADAATPPPAPVLHPAGDGGRAPDDPPPRTATPRLGGKRTRAVTGIAGAALLAAGAAAAYFAFADRGPDHPSKWDPRVAPLAEFVTHERGLEFDHPVYVDFLTEAAFEEKVTSDEAALDDEGREGLRQATAMIRALGLAGPDVDLFKASNDLAGSSILAYYDDEQERITVRGTALTAGLRATLVHELTHALQDQHYDIGELLDRDSVSETGIYRALIEGDAERIETAFTDLPSDEGPADAAEPAEEELPVPTDIPPFLTAMFSAPYSLGEPLVRLIVAEEGMAGLDGALRMASLTDEHLFDPWSLLDGAPPALDVAPPPLRDGERELDRGVMGSVAWYLILESRIDPVVALDAVDGWGGDAYVVFERGEQMCVRIAYEGDQPADVEQMGGALMQWVTAMPSGAASLARDGGLLTLESCDPGGGATAPVEPDESLLLLPVLRAVSSAEIAEDNGDATPVFTRCYVNRIVRETSRGELIGAPGPDFEQRLAAMATSCL